MKTKLVRHQCNPFHASGLRGRTASWIATVAICACTAGRLDAVVIDDFQDGVKFAEGGGGTNYFAWGVTGGRLVVNRASPVPTPTNALVTYDNVYWPNSLPDVSLEGGRTLELRMDLDHTTTDDLFLVLMCGGRNAGADSDYAVFIDRNEVALLKGRSHFTTFYWDTLTTTNENVTVKLALTRTNSSLAITVKVVDKGNQQATLYQRTFVDGPGQDGPVPPPDPHGIGLFTPDADGPFTNFTYAAAGVWQIIRTNPPPLEMWLDNLEYDVYALGIANSVLLSWLPNMPGEQIVVGASSLDSNAVWTPWPEPIFNRFGNVCISVPTTAQKQFFRLVPGNQFIDDFDPPKWPYATKGNWVPYLANQADSTRIVCTNVDGALRIYTVTPPVDGRIVLLPPGPDVIVGDFYASVDILKWPGPGKEVGPWVRGTIYRTNINNSNGYIASFSRVRNQVVLWDGSQDHYGPSFTLDPAARHRLSFWGVGNNLSMRLVNLETGASVEHALTFTRWNQGPVALFIAASAGGTLDVTLDNFFITGTKP